MVKDPVEPWAAVGTEAQHVDAFHAECLAQGIDVTWPPTDMPWHVREMHIRHPDGHVFRVGKGTESA